MSVYYDYSRFVFCNEEEAKEVMKEVDDLQTAVKGADYTYYYEPYDKTHQGIMINSSKRNNPVDDFKNLSSRFQTFVLTYVDCEGEYWTNDADHIIFPKYFIEGEEVYTEKEVIDYIKKNDAEVFADPDAPNPDIDPVGFIKYWDEGYRGLDIQMVHVGEAPGYYR